MNNLQAGSKDSLFSPGKLDHLAEPNLLWQANDGLVSDRQPEARLLGELLSYKGNRVDPLESAIRDWKNAALQPDQLNGRFLLMFFDEAAQETTVITDPLGSFHTYALYHGDRIEALHTDLLALAASSQRRLDWEAITTFFAFGFFLDARTYFDDVRILLPGSVYRVAADGRYQVERYWQWQARFDDRRSYDDTVDAYHAVFTQAVARCMTGERVMLPISGGLDSRSVAAVMPRDGTVQAYSYGYTPDSVETAIASQIARARSFPFTAHTIQPYLFDRLPEIVHALHGSQDVTQARQASVSDWVGERADTVLTGLWGDVWCDQMGLADGLPDGSTLAQFAYKKFRKRGSQWLLQHVAAPQLGQRDVERYLHDRIADGLASTEAGGDDDFRFKIYKTTHWAFRWSNTSLRAFELGAIPRIPYYDIDLARFFCTVPTAFARDRQLQIDHLKRYAPDLARIKWQEASANIYLARYGRWLSLPGRAYRKVARQLHQQRPIQRNWEVQFLSPGGREGLEYWLLRPGLKIEALIPRPQIGELLAAFFAGPDASNGYAVSILLTFSAWLEAVG